MRPLPLLLAAGLIGLTAAAAPADAHRGLRMFDRADADNSGKMSRAEFDAARNARFVRIDANKDGTLEISELRAWWRTLPSRFRDARFKALDADGDGKVGAEEYVARRKATFTRIDADKSGTVDKAEFDAAFDTIRERMLEQYGAHRGKRSNRWNDRRGRRLEQRLDLNADGKVTRAEFDAVGSLMFLRLDRDGDGAVTRREARMAFRRFDRHGDRR